MSHPVVAAVRALLADRIPCRKFTGGPGVNVVINGEPAITIVPCRRCNANQELHLLRDLLAAWSETSLAHVALAKTTLNGPEWARSVYWHEQRLTAQDVGTVAPLDPELVELLVADSHVLRALAAAVISATVLPVETPVAAGERC